MRRRSGSPIELLSFSAALLALAFFGLVPPARAGPEAERTETLYTLIAMPYFELDGWGMIQNRPATYNIMAVLSRGENTNSCLNDRDDSPGDPEEHLGPEKVPFAAGFVPPGGQTGAHKYQGPKSPVGQPDKKERKPLGNPWQGRGTEDCGDARVASWHWFLDGMAGRDTTLPDMGTLPGLGPQGAPGDKTGGDPRTSPAYRGRFCDGPAGCAEVWATEKGARVVFEMGDHDGTMTVERITAAVARMRSDRAKWGIPVLPEAGVLGATYWAPPTTVPGVDCAPSVAADPATLHKAIWEVDFGAGPQWAPVCSDDPRFLKAPGPQKPTDPATLVYANFVDADHNRIGPYVREYGWLFPNYYYGGRLTPHFFERFGKPVEIPEVSLPQMHPQPPGQSPDLSDPPGPPPRVPEPPGVSGLPAGSNPAVTQPVSQAGPSPVPKAAAAAPSLPGPVDPAPPGTTSVPGGASGPSAVPGIFANAAPSHGLSVHGAAVLVAGVSADARHTEAPRAAGDLAMTGLKDNPLPVAAGGALIVATFMAACRYSNTRSIRGDGEYNCQPCPRIAS